jgi:NAD-dependent SIR2 family protein deacetylase
MVRQIEAFIRNFSRELKENNAAIFAGAGLSVEVGFVDWKSLLKPITEELGLDVDKEDNLVSIAQYHCNEKLGNRNRLNQQLINEFNRVAGITENHKILARLPINTYWTTNYDKLIEKALEMAYKVPDVKYTINQLATTKPKRDVIVYKMHGDVEHPDQAVLTKDDYESYHIKFAPFITALSGDLVSKTFLFLGFSFTDPNLDYILSRIRATYTHHQRQSQG